MADEHHAEFPPQTPIEGVPVVYMNWFRTLPGARDFSVDIGYNVGGLPPQPAAHVVMTWEYAKILRDALSESIASFEEEVGEIRNLDEIVSTALRIRQPLKPRSATPAWAGHQPLSYVQGAQVQSPPIKRTPPRKDLLKALKAAESRVLDPEGYAEFRNAAARVIHDDLAEASFRTLSDS